MAVSIVRARLGVKSQMVLPKRVREVLGLAPGDELAFVINGGEVRIARAPGRRGRSVRLLYRMGVRGRQEGLCRPLTAMTLFRYRSPKPTGRHSNGDRL